MKSTSNHDKIMKRYSWESEELFQLRKIKYKLIVVCEKPSMSNFASLCGLVEAEETRLIKRDAYENNNKIEDDEEIKTSECCGKEMHEDYDLCPKCLEHT